MCACVRTVRCCLYSCGFDCGGGCVGGGCGSDVCLNLSMHHAVRIEFWEPDAFGTNPGRLRHPRPCTCVQDPENCTKRRSASTENVQQFVDELSRQPRHTVPLELLEVTVDENRVVPENNAPAAEQTTVLLPHWQLLMPALQACHLRNTLVPKVHVA